MILVTGSTGFVGRHLVRMLQDRGLPCRPVSRNPHSGHVAIGAMSEHTDWSAALSGVGCVIHLAARVHVMRESAADPMSAFRQMNVEATLNLARQAARAGVRRFVFVSSVKVNGEMTQPGQAFGPDDAPDPQDAYGLSKAEAEAALRALGLETGLEIVVVRPPLVYGPGVQANFRLLMRWAGSGLPSPFGACDNRRSLVFVDNLADLLIAAADHPQAAGQTFLASDGEDLSTQELFSRLARLQGRRGYGLPIPPALMHRLAALAGRQSHSQRLLSNLQVDIAKNNALLGWTPPISVEVGLRRTVDGERLLG
jgi:UDP-glucose 4-epimerase